jgi:hypothetical protein
MSIMFHEMLLGLNRLEYGRMPQTGTAQTVWNQKQDDAAEWQKHAPSPSINAMILESSVSPYASEIRLRNGCPHAPACSKCASTLTAHKQQSS